ncbi:cation-independent mannose-6-phosphate receptor isoform X1 [Neodiprion fabricii]|uniref:cation-independent mannose-6-phosphate receptor isoform X1 n=2 Tax=Neodiprion fabricii TaxID=2872261 RepID=UPI001ED8FEA2|nr:cation-independent mannose-6-phosphate receptor isoform X1 [Neodiprion fabricii]
MPECRLYVSLSILIAILTQLVFSQKQNFTCHVTDSEHLHKHNFTELSSSDITIYDESADGNITLRLCSPLSQTCAGSSDYSICLRKHGTEIGLGKFPPLLQNNHTSMFTFTGDLCSNSKNYTVLIIMKCQENAIDTTIPQLIPKAKYDHCSTYFIWYTKWACNKPKNSNCTVVDERNNLYDLSPLTAYKNNYVVYIDDKGNLVMNINVCHSVIHEYGSACYGTAGACLAVYSNDSSNHEYINYGEVNQALTINNGNLEILYTHGHLCNDESEHSYLWTNITFICDPEATEYTQPMYKNNTSCNYEFVWKTSLACNKTYLNEYAKKCKVTNPRTKYIYNMKALSFGYVMTNTSDGTQYQLQICGPLRNSKCPQGTGVCNTKDFVSAGMANANLMWRHGGPYLNYTNGVKCENGRNHYTLISFICGPEESTGLPIIVKNDSCSLIIYWYTNRACEKRLRCGEKETNLLPLVRTSKNYVAKGMGTEFHINICLGVIPTPGLACPPGSAVCQAARTSEGQYTNETSLGYPDETTILLDKQNVILNYSQGSPCPENPLKNLSSSFKFSCNYYGDHGSPEFENYSNCHFSFTWKTNIVCATLVGVWVPPCTVKDTTHANKVDLSLLYPKPVPRIVTGTGKNYSINICGGKEHCNGSAICQGTNGYGTIRSVMFDYNSKAIKLVYGNGSTCSGDSYTSELSLICNDSVGIDSGPKLILHGYCMASFEWHTKIACPEKVMLDSRTSTDPVYTTETTPARESLQKNDAAVQTWAIVSALLLVAVVLIAWFCMRNPRRCSDLRYRISAITASRNHSTVQYSRVNTTEEAHLLLDTSDPCGDGEIDSDDELLGV